MSAANRGGGVHLAQTTPRPLTSMPPHILAHMSPKALKARLKTHSIITLKRQASPCARETPAPQSRERKRAGEARTPAEAPDPQTTHASTTTPSHSPFVISRTKNAFQRIQKKECRERKSIKPKSGLVSPAAREPTPQQTEIKDIQPFNPNKVPH